MLVVMFGSLHMLLVTLLSIMSILLIYGLENGTW